MIGLKVAGEWMDVSPGTSITLRLASPVFSQEIGYSSHSFKFTLPWSRKNRRLMDFAGIITSTGLPAEIDAELYFRNSPVFPGKIRVHSVDPVSLDAEVSLTTADGNLSTILQTLNLREIDHGGLQVISTAITAVAVYELTQVETPPSTLSISVNGTIYKTTWQVGWSEYDAMSAIAALINSDPPNLVQATLTTGPPAQMTLTSDGAGFPFLIDTETQSNQHTWNEISFTSTGTTTMDDMTAQMDTLANMSPGSAVYVFPPVKADNFYAGLNADYLGYLNLYDPVLGEYVKNANSAGQYTRNSAVPFPQLKQALVNSLIAAGNYTLSSSFIDGDAFIRIYLYNNVTLDQIDTGTGVNWYRPSFDLADHMPDMSCFDIVKGVAALFNLAVQVDEQSKIVYFYPRIDVFTSSEVDRRDQTLIPYQVQYPDPEAGKAYSYAEDKTDKRFFNQSWQADGVVEGAGKEKRESKLTPIFISSTTDPINAQSWTVPHVDQTGNTPYPEVGENDFSARLMLYHGMQPNGSANDYPAASNLDRFDGAQLSAWHLRWKGEFGIYEIFHKPFNELRDQAPEGEFSMKLSLPDIQNPPWVNRIRMRAIEGDFVAILKEIEVTMDDTGLQPAKVKLIRV